MDKLSKKWIKCIEKGQLGSGSFTCFSLRTENLGLNLRIFHPRDLFFKNRPENINFCTGHHFLQNNLNLTKHRPSYLAPLKVYSQKYTIYFWTKKFETSFKTSHGKIAHAKGSSRK